MTVVVGVDGAGRSHCLDQIAATAGATVVRLDRPAGPGLSDLLAAAATAGHTVLVDDAHRRSPQELAALTSAARQGCAMVLARRPTIDGQDLAELDEMLASRGELHQLEPLTLDEVAGVLASHSGQAPAAEWVAALHTASAGLPAILMALVDSRPSDAGLAVTGALLARVQRRLAMLDPKAVGLARLLALRLDLSDSVLAAASELDSSAVAAAMRLLRDSGLLCDSGLSRDSALLRDGGPLVNGFDTMVPAVAQAIMSDLPAMQRRRVHEAVARAMLDAGADVAVSASQLRAARAVGPAAARIYQATAERIRFTDPAAALGWYDDAIEAGAEVPELAAGRAEATALLGMPVDPGQPVVPAGAGRLVLVDGAIEAHQGRADRSAQALAGARPPGPVLAVPALVSIGRLGELPAAGDAGPGAAVPGGVAAAMLDGMAAAMLDGVAAATPGSLGATDETATRGVAALRRLAEGARLAATDPGASVALLIEAAEALERTPPAVVLPDTAHALGALMASAAGDVASAEYLLDRALSTGAGGPVATRRHQLLLAWVRLRAGRYDTAVAELARSDGAELAGRDRFLLAAISAGVARRSGDVARLREAWQSVEPALARRVVDLFLVEAVEELAVAATRLRRYSRVAAVLDALERIVAALGQPPPWMIAVGWIRLQVAVANEDASAAAQMAATMAATATVAASDASRLRAQSAAAGVWADVLAGDVDEAAVLAAAELLVGAELPWEASRLVGQAGIRTTDPSLARRLLERARDLSSAEVSTDRRTDRSAEAATTIRHGGLSEREVEVARMVVTGNTYREIGARLFISPKTVEHHVARIRNKLGANTRAEFLAALHRLLDDPAPTRH